jgi:hypothetical protein
MTLTRKRRYPRIPRFTEPEEIVKELGWGRRWRPDPIRGVLDVMSHPTKVQSKIDEGTIGVGDCDDHAIYWATALLQNNLAKRAWLGTIWCERPNGKSFGHVVCVWDDGRDKYWSDYFRPYRFLTKWEWAEAYGRDRGVRVMYAGLIEVELRRSGHPKLVKKTETLT